MGLLLAIAVIVSVNVFKLKKSNGTNLSVDNYEALAQVSSGGGFCSNVCYGWYCGPFIYDCEYPYPY